MKLVNAQSNNIQIYKSLLSINLVPRAFFPVEKGPGNEVVLSIVRSNFSQAFLVRTHCCSAGVFPHWDVMIGSN